MGERGDFKMMKSLQKIIRRISSAPNAEASQAGIVRPLAGAIVTLYAWAIYPPGAWQISTTALIWLYMVLGGTIVLIWIYRHPVIAPNRYLLALFIDMSGLTAAVYVNNEYGLALYPLYMWIAFGYGLRFGGRYLIICALSSSAGFALLWLVMPIWHNHLHNYLFVWYTLGLLLVPSYGAIFLNKLKDALEKKADVANQLKSDLMNNMSHELRTPLNPLLGYAEMLLYDDSLSADTKKIITIIEREGRHLLMLIDNVLEASRIHGSRSGRSTEIAVTPFDLRDLIRHTVSLFSNSSKGLEITSQVDGSVPENIVSSEQIIGLCLFNLLSNAIKFTSVGTITIKAYRADNTLFISVIDPGCGIPAKKQDEIFELFNQADNSITRRYGGMGLGLHIVRDSITALGGEIRVQSAEFVGSTFTLLIPLTDVDADTKKITNTAPHYTILTTLPADNRLIPVLTQLGHHVVGASDGQECISKLFKGDYQFCLIHQQLADISPTQIVGCYRTAHYQGKHTRFILLCTDTDDIDEAGLSQFDSIIQLPVQHTKLNNMLHSLQGGRA